MDISTTLSSNTLVKGAEEPQTPATSRYATWMSMCVVLVGVNQEKVVKHKYSNRQ